MHGTIGSPVGPLSMPSRSDLIALLAAYHPSDEAEQRFVLAMAELAAAALDPFDRHAYNPGHFTASAFVVHPGGGSVLLVHHAALGIWVQPGGHIDAADPTPVAAAAREVFEETGIAELNPVIPGLFDVDLHAVSGSASHPRHLHHDLRFAFVAGTETLTANAEVLEAAWVGPGELGEYGVDLSVTRPVGKLFG